MVNIAKWLWKKIRPVQSPPPRVTYTVAGGWAFDENYQPVDEERYLKALEDCDRLVRWDEGRRSR